MANGITPKARKYKSNNLIGMASKHMENYRFSDERLDIPPEDVGVIILIALYFIENDKAVSRTRLEAYILMLDKKCFKERGVILFGWTLKGGRIRNFKAITDYMLKRGLIRIKGRSYFELDTSGKALGSSYAMLSNIKYWLDEILREYKDKTGSDTLSAVLPPKPTAQCMTALTNAGRAMKANGTTTE